MRQKLDNPAYMTFDDIKMTFNGKWVYITNAHFTPYMEFLGGVPVVVADYVYEGQADGLYDEFRDKRYAPRTEWDFTESVPELLNAFFANPDGDET